MFVSIPATLGIKYTQARKSLRAVQTKMSKTAMKNFYSCGAFAE
jgi:hypothetical protein